MKHTILGAIAGDIIGSSFEGRHNNTKSTEFDLFRPWNKFTDDTVLTVAVADAILNQKSFRKTIHAYGNKYQGRGYGGGFRKWLASKEPRPYNSFGNGSAMRVSAVGFAYNAFDEVMDIAMKTALCSHNHPEGIKGAQAIALAIFLARTGSSKEVIRENIAKIFDYKLNFTIEEIRPTYTFDVTCQGSVPQAIVAFLDSEDYESTIRLAISIGGDSDTIACMAGGIAAAFYKEIPQKIVDFAYSKLGNEMIEIIEEFDKKFF